MVTLNGLVNPHGIATETLFEWGLDAGALSQQTAVQAVSGSAPRTVSATIGSLKPATRYYYRAVARNEVGSRHGTTLSFTTPASFPAPGAIRAKLAFVRAGAIYIHDPTNERTIRLTGDGKYTYPAWSPDGTRIAFAQEDAARIYVINADGSGLQLVGDGHSPAWSPDGHRLAFAGREDGNDAILVKSIDDPDQPLLRIGFDRGYLDFPAWSPDGTRIAFVSDWMAFDLAGDVFIANADGSGEIAQVTNGFFGDRTNRATYTRYAQPSWSPDGMSLAVVECYEWQFFSCAISRVGVIGVDGSAFQLLANATGFARPGWAPDGSALVFSRTCWYHDCPSAVFEVALDGTGEQLLIQDAHSATFRP